MNRKSRVSFGPGAASLILIVVILSMSVLGMLALMNARSDHQLSVRSIAVVEAGYGLNAAAERSLAALDAVLISCAETSDSDEAYLDTVRSSLPEGMRLEEHMVTWNESDGLRTLECAVELLPMGDAERYSWRIHRLSAVTEEIWN